MIEHIGSSPRPHWATTLVTWVVVIVIAVLVGRMGLRVTELDAEISTLRDRVHALEARPIASEHPDMTPLEHQTQAARAEAEWCHTRVDKLIDGIIAFAPRIEGRDRVPRIIEEARR